MSGRKRCAYCKKMFTPPKRGRAPKYCSASHRQMAYVKRLLDPHAAMKYTLKRDLADIRARARKRPRLQLVK
jgi:hypothetical protein